jgi:pimeloyl-ACP methyl ester carboxylesterase
MFLNIFCYRRQYTGLERNMTGVSKAKEFPQTGCQKQRARGMSVYAMLVAALACLAAIVVISYLVEALRPSPERPSKLSWAPEIAIEYADLDGVKVRYIKTGAGPNLLLLHTLRTQLDIFQKVVAELAKHFTIYACDYPGHGWSDIPKADYALEDFYKWTAAFLDKLDIRQASIAGMSIGGTIALILAARQNPRMRQVIAINPYDYWPSGGVRKSSLAARLILMPAGIPILGATLMRLRNRFVSDRIMEGGVASANSLPRELKKELYEAGERPGHYQGFLKLLAHERLWPGARKDYPRIKVPVLLVYGEQDWAPIKAREYDRSLIPGVMMETVRQGGHFLSLDRPKELEQLILGFLAGKQTQRTA